MDAITAYDSSDEEDHSASEELQRQSEAPDIDHAESSNVLSQLKERFPLNSAPNVPSRVRNYDLVGINWSNHPSLKGYSGTVLSNCAQSKSTITMPISQCSSLIPIPAYD